MKPFVSIDLIHKKASELEKSENIKHQKALDKAAVAFGLSGYKEAIRIAHGMNFASLISGGLPSSREPESKKDVASSLLVDCGVGKSVAVAFGEDIEPAARQRVIAENLRAQLLEGIKVTAMFRSEEERDEVTQIIFEEMEDASYDFTRSFQGFIANGLDEAYRVGMDKLADSIKTTEAPCLLYISSINEAIHSYPCVYNEVIYKSLADRPVGMAVKMNSFALQTFRRHYRYEILLVSTVKYAHVARDGQISGCGSLANSCFDQIYFVKGEPRRMSVVPQKK